ncbi:MAG: hypothetical protein ACE5FO_11705, partial [Parvularculaceae bacterium]
MCESAEERLDGNNRLLLVPHVDKLFDIGLISFERDGKVLVSATLGAHSKTALNIQAAIQNGVGVKWSCLFGQPGGDFKVYPV